MNAELQDDPSQPRIANDAGLEALEEALDQQDPVPQRDQSSQRRPRSDDGYVIHVTICLMFRRGSKDNPDERL